MPNPLRTWLKDHLPQRFVGRVEFHLEPERLDSWGGAFNGQCFRQLMFLDIVNACRFGAIVETGSFRGSTTLFLCQNSNGVPVYSTEINPRFHQIARLRLHAQKNLHLYNLDSRTFLAALKLPRETCTFFYLDAHWYADLPLADETTFILHNFDSFVVMIDDFEVPSDDGYQCDDYGHGKRLSLRDFPFQNETRVVTYFPSRPAIRESGLRRGSIVLASQDLRTKLDALDSLRPYLAQAAASTTPR
jgi:hypothetical protein